MSETIGYNLEQRLEASKHLNLSDTLLAFIRLQHEFGLRISDMLKINHTNITSALDIIVNQSKGSKQLILHPRSNLDIWKSIKENNLDPMAVYSRYSLYRLYNKIGLSLPNEQKGNQSVTHSARKIKARQVFEDTQSIEITANVIGHKNTNSTLYYLTGDQKRMVVKDGILGNPVGTIQGIQVNKKGVMRFVTDI
jgi:hypothetical protein